MTARYSVVPAHVFATTRYPQPRDGLGAHAIESQPSSLHIDAIMLISLTVGKVDAGVAVLLTEDKRLVTAPFQGAALTFTDFSPCRSNFPPSFSLPQSPQVA